MNKDLHNIDDLFKNSIDGHAEELPPEVWKNIDHSLDKKQAAFYRRKYFNIRAAAILLLLIGGATIAALLHFNKEGRSSQPNSENAVTTSGLDNNKLKQEKEGLENTSKSPAVKNKRNDQQPVTLNKKEPDRFDKSQLNDRTIVARKTSEGNSKPYGSANNSSYAAAKNAGMSSVSKDKTKTKKNGSNYPPVSKTSVDLVARPPEKVVEPGQTPLISDEATYKPGEIKNSLRTTYVEAKSLKTNEAGLAATFSSMGLRSPIDFPVATSVAKAAERKISLDGWSISPMYFQNINLNTLRDDDHFRDPRNNSREAKRTEQTTTSFTAGLGIRKEFVNNIGLQTGLQYFSSQTEIQPKTIFAKPDDHGDVRYQFRCSSGDSYLSSTTGSAPSIGDSIKTNYSESVLSYLQVPLMISYRIRFGKISLVPSAGFQTNFLLSGKLNSSLPDPTGEEEVSSPISGLKSMYLSGVIQPQLNYRLNDRVSFDFSPNVNFSMSPINKETAVKTYQNMLSLGAGVRVKL